MNKTLYILRHGETDLNRDRIVQGSGMDTDLNDTGRAQAQAFFDRYRDLPFEAVLTSKLRRTHQTVAPFLALGLPWEQFPELNEMGWGVHEGQRPTPTMEALHQQVLEMWRNGDYSAKLEGGESAAELEDRLQRFIDHLRQRPEQLLLICSHGRAMRALLALLEGDTLNHMERHQHANTGLYVVQQRENRFWIERENDISHLPDLATTKV